MSAPYIEVPVATMYKATSGELVRIPVKGLNPKHRAANPQVQIDPIAAKILQFIRDSKVRISREDMTGKSGLPRRPETIRQHVKSLLELSFIDEPAKGKLEITIKGRDFLDQ
jgi:hypothetical protein